MKLLVLLALLGCVLAEPEAKAGADADAWYGSYGLGYRGYGGYGLGYRYYGLGYGGYGGYGLGYGSHYIGKRSADSEPEAEAVPEADAWYGGYGLGYRGYGGYGGYGLG